MKAMETLGTFLQGLAARYSERPALLYQPGATLEVWSYNRLWEQANRIAAWLETRGVSKGDQVVIWAPSAPVWVAAWFGVARLGAVAVPIDMRSSPDFVERVVGQTDPKIALLAKSTREQWKSPAPVALLDDLAALTDGTPATALSAVQPGDILELMFTSGTTGNPKGVILTHANIMSNVMAIDQLVPNYPQYKVLSILPLSHSLEQTIGLLVPLKRGASIYYLGNFQPATLLRAFQEQGVTTTLLVPQALQLIMTSIEREIAKQGKTATWERGQKIARFLPVRLRRRLFREIYNRLGGHMEFLMSGGAPLAPELIRKWELIGIPVLQGYGTTETAPAISIVTLKNYNRESVGKPVPGVQVKIADDGEVLVKGPNVFAGYWQNEEATHAAFTADGWYKTGDLGQFDAQGYLHLHGRKKDLIVLGSGQNVYPQDIEEILRAIPGVKDAAVVGLPAAQGPQVHAVLLLDPAAPAPDTIIRQANEQLAPHQRIRGVTVWPDPDFPRTHTLKVKKHEVLAALQQQDAARPAARS
jgi:long-chain acyl-CoA synthetase